MSFQNKEHGGHPTQCEEPKAKESSEVDVIPQINGKLDQGSHRGETNEWRVLVSSS